MRLAIDTILLEPEFQPRAEINSETVQEYADAMRDGTTFPPVTVYKNGNGYYLTDGWHRVLAAKVAKQTEIEAEVKEGNRRDALLASIQANITNGLRRTNADKRRAVLALLNDKEWSKKTDREIARIAGVDHKTVLALRDELELSGEIPQIDTRTVQRGSTIYTMETVNIGKPGLHVVTPEERFPGYFAEPQETDSHKPTFNRTNDNIEWAAWSWNPVTGCEYGCTYCYARDIANRFYAEKFKPTFHPERLAAPGNTNPALNVAGGDKVFVCSMADLFGAWVPDEWIDPVLESVERNPQWTFIFLTKNPRRLASVKFPPNAWVGCTVDTQARVKPAEQAMAQVQVPVKFLSCEPMLEPLKFDDLSVVNWVIIGSQSQSSGAPEFQPEFEWVFSLTQQAKEANCKVYWKPNLKSRPREYPGK